MDDVPGFTNNEQDRDKMETALYQNNVRIWQTKQDRKCTLVE